MHSLLGDIYVNLHMSYVYDMYFYVGYNVMKLRILMSLESVCLSFL